LDAAEHLFACKGFNGVSVREIVRRAQTTLGSIPYHFGSKENLFKQVFMRRMLPVQEERRRRLDELIASTSKPTVEDVLRAILEPVFRASRANDSFRRLAGRAALDPTESVQKILAEIYNAEFIVTPRALRRACPDLPEDAFYWRLFCVYAVMVYVQADTGKMQTIAGKEFDTSDTERALEFVIPFLAAGLRTKPRKSVPMTSRRAAPKEKRIELTF
jgi:AcrR family transcriptional regulator